MTDEERMAERLARQHYGDGWDDLNERTRAKRVEIWRGMIEKIRRAGLEILAQADADRELLLAEIDRLRAQIVSLEATGSEAADEIDRLHKALYRIAGKVPFADDPWTIARNTLEGKP